MTTPLPHQNHTTLGIMLIIVAVFMMSIQDALFKDLSHQLSLWQIFTLRGFFAIPLFILFFRFQRQPRSIWKVALQKWTIIRALLFTASFIALYAAMPFLSLSTVAAGYYTAPIFIAIFSVIFLGERLGLRGICSILLGFVGVLVMLRPDSEAFTLWALLPVLGGMLYGLANITTRSKCRQLPAPALALSVNLTLLALGILATVLLLITKPTDALVQVSPYLLNDWSALHLSAGLKIIVLSLLIMGIATCIAKAYQITSPPTIATFEYCYLIFASLWDYWFFNSLPSWFSFIGIVLIVVSGWLVSLPNKADKKLTK